MDRLKVFFFVLIYLITCNLAVSQIRVVILSDFPPVDVIPGGAGYGPNEKRSDPDDVQSMVRFLLYSNEFSVEGLVASSATFANIANKQHILDLLDIYDFVDDNLKKRDSRFPAASELRAVTWQGLSGTYGKPVSEIIGEGKDSEASENIIKLLQKPDERPVWFCIWGGSGDLAQALWKIKNTHDPSEAKRLFSKVRIYMIGLQDGSGQWLLDQFNELFIIMSLKNYFGMFNNAPGSDIKLSDLEWVNRHIRKGHGILGAIYPESGYFPETPGVWEGDSPSFLYLVSAVKGLNDPDKPEQDSWGGKFIRPDPLKTHWFDDPVGLQVVYKWRKEVQEDFSVRAKWMLP